MHAQACFFHPSMDTRGVGSSERNNEYFQIKEKQATLP